MISWNLHSYIYRPRENHPAFYGCFDWHSSVHGHWLLATVARRYPNTELADNVTAVFREQFRVNLNMKLSIKILFSWVMFMSPYGICRKLIASLFLGGKNIKGT